MMYAFSRHLIKREDESSIVTFRGFGYTLLKIDENLYEAAASSRHDTGYPDLPNPTEASPVLVSDSPLPFEPTVANGEDLVIAWEGSSDELEAQGIFLAKSSADFSKYLMRDIDPRFLVGSQRT